LKGAIPDRQLWWEDLRWVREYFRKGCCCRGAAYLNNSFKPTPLRGAA
jgi:hypothetical protein